MNQNTNYPTNKNSGYNNRNQSGHRNFASKNDALDRLKSDLGTKDFSELSYEVIAKENGIAEILGKEKNALKVTQLRKFFDQIKKIEIGITDGGWTDNVSRDFFMLRPQLAYAKGRDLISGEFYDLMSFCIDKVNTSSNKIEAYRRFSSLIEATVAYRKFYE